MGHEQEIICAMYEGEINNYKCMGELCEPENRRGELCEPVYNPVIFNTNEMPIKIAGMSDVMPYETIKYSDLAKDEKMLELWMKAFEEKINEVVDRFKPDLIICHHLYLLTAMVIDKRARNARPYDDKDRPYDDKDRSYDDKDCPYNDKDRNSMGRQNVIPYIYGICHNTDLRQYQQTNLKREFIKENINKLDKIFSPSEEHKNKIVELFGADKNKIEVIGIGYNSDIFYRDEKLRDDRKEKDGYNKNIKLLYVGKVAKKKGVLSLVKAFKQIKNRNISLDIAGGAGDKDEYEEILNECKTSSNKITIIPPMSQAELAREYNSHDIFILPSFSEGIPMVPIEALACGSKLVISDLPGVREFYEANIKNASIKYVKLPKLSNVDDAEREELEAFEKRLAEAIIESIEDGALYRPELSNISWENITKRIIE